MKTALVLGCTGQDGSYLVDILLEKGYKVYGLVRRSSTGNFKNIQHNIGNPNFTIVYGDVLDTNCIRQVLKDVVPDEIYNEADQDSVRYSHFCPTYQFNITAGFVATLLEAVRQSSPIPDRTRIFQPCTAMMFGDAAYLPAQTQSPQNEETPFNPQSPYACAKVAAYYLCRYYREQHGLFVSTGILYNHDSPRRSEHYLLHKIALGVKRIKAGNLTSLALGNLDAKVDIGYAKEYMEAAWKMLQMSKPDDFVIGTGKLTSVGDLARAAFDCVGLTPSITIDREFYRESPSNYLVADITKAKDKLNWEPTWDADYLVRRMVTR